MCKELLLFFVYTSSQKFRSLDFLRINKLCVQKLFEFFPLQFVEVETIFYFNLNIVICILIT